MKRLEFILSKLILEKSELEMELEFFLNNLTSEDTFYNEIQKMEEIIKKISITNISILNLTEIIKNNINNNNN
jgi:purine-nucleoside phosphorylase